jgi:hypothetical protein
VRPPVSRHGAGQAAGRSSSEEAADAAPVGSGAQAAAAFRLAHRLLNVAHEEIAMNTSTAHRTPHLLIALAVTFAAMVGAYLRIGLPPVIIVGGSGMIGLLLWRRTYLDEPLDPRVILPPFLLTVAALELHMAEEYLNGFAPAISRVFDASWTERSFLVSFAFVGPALYALTALGLFYRVRLAGFVAMLIFVGPGVAEFTHFIFPLIKPAISPDLLEPVSQVVSNGHFVGGMQNYWLHATGRYYFPGMYTAALPMIPGIWALVRTLSAARAARAARARRDSDLALAA